jgi:hypothetical protein
MQQKSVDTDLAKCLIGECRHPRQRNIEEPTSNKLFNPLILCLNFHNRRQLIHLGSKIEMIAFFLSNFWLREHNCPGVAG